MENASIHDILFLYLLATLERVASATPSQNPLTTSLTRVLSLVEYKLYYNI